MYRMWIKRRKTQKSVFCIICKVQNQAKVINGDRSQKSGYLLIGRQKGTIWGAGNGPYLDLSAGYTWVYFVKIHWVVHSWCVYFTICMLHFKKGLQLGGKGSKGNTDILNLWTGWILTILESICSLIQRDHHPFYLLVAAELMSILFWCLTFHQILWAKIS